MGIIGNFARKAALNTAARVAYGVADSKLEKKYSYSAVRKKEAVGARLWLEGHYTRKRGKYKVKDDGGLCARNFS